MPGDPLAHRDEQGRGIVQHERRGAVVRCATPRVGRRSPGSCSASTRSSVVVDCEPRTVASSGTTMRLPVDAQEPRRGRGIAADVVLDALRRAVVLHRAEHAAHQHDAQRQALPRRRAARRSSTVRCRRSTSTPAMCAAVGGPATTSTSGSRRCERTRPGGSTSPSTVLTPTSSASRSVRRAPQRDRVVGIRPDVGVDPEPHRRSRSDRFERAGEHGYWKRKPTRFELGRHAPADSRAAASRRVRRRSAASTGAAASASTVGRCSTRPSVCANSALVTGFGAVRLTGPRKPVVVDRGAERGRPRRRARSNSSTACPNPACRRGRA